VLTETKNGQTVLPNNTTADINYCCIASVCLYVCCMAEEGRERCDNCGQLYTTVTRNDNGSPDVGRPTRCCPDCVAHTSNSIHRSTTRTTRQQTPAGDAFRIHSLVGDTAPPPRKSTGSTPNNSSSQQQPPFLVQAAAAQAQYYALAASGLLKYAGINMSRGEASMPPLEWTTSAGLAAKQRYGV